MNSLVKSQTIKIRLHANLELELSKIILFKVFYRSQYPQNSDSLNSYYPLLMVAINSFSRATTCKKFPVITNFGETTRELVLLLPLGPSMKQDKFLFPIKSLRKKN